MKKLLAGCALAALATSAVHAQETTSSIRGTVTAAGQPVANATVEIVHVPTNTRITVTTDDKGGFSASGLRVGGPYTISVNAQGFQPQQVTDVQTVVAQTYELPVQLTPVVAQAPAQEIVVTATRLAGARTVSQGPTTVLNAAQIANVASINRDIRDLERRDPFARLDDTPTGGRSISFAGQNARFNTFSVDGVPITDNFGLNPDGLPSRRSPIPFDAIGQFQAKVAPYDVREGRFQGGSINIITKSGTNEFHGTGFYARSGDEFVGDRTKDLRATIPNFKVDNYGAELSGPIIKDKVFFMVSGERLRGGRPIAEGTPENNAGTVIPGVTQAQVDQITSIAKNVYNYDTGGLQRSSGDKDDRVIAKIDANLTERQRLTLTYSYANDAINLLNNTFTTTPYGLGLASNAYIQGNQLHTGVVQLNSQWSDDFSTEARGFYKHYKRIQDPVLGRGFAQFRVCTNATDTPASVLGSSPTACENNAAIVSFGPDNSRQTNALHTETWGGTLQARLTKNDHDLRVFGEYQRVSVFNSFLQNSAGNYYFDSIADLQNRTANQLSYQNAVPSLVPDDAAARFQYQSYAFGIQDSWRIDPTLTISAGARYDLFGQHDRPVLNSAFASRYANGAYVMGQLVQVGNNRQNIGGLGLFQPRMGFDWKPLRRLSVRGGGGIFGGSAPDVYVSNSFSNTGVLSNTVSINRTATGGFSGATTNAAIGTAALNGVTGTSIPGAVNTLLTNATVSTAASTNALDQRFHVPSQWRATISADYAANLGPLGDNWNFGADFFYSKVRNQVYFTDIRSVPILGNLTPDGRQRYANAIDGAASTNTNTDILLTNTHRGRSYVAVARLDKSWKFGLNIYGSFTYQDVKDQAPATSSTAGSNYSNGAFVDPNNVAYGISNDQVKYFFKYGATFDHSFFRDYKTTIALFGESRIGHPFSYTFQDFGGTRSAVFGTTGVSSGTGVGGNRYLMYVPLVNDPLIQYSSASYQAALNNFIDSSGLAKYRGRVAPRNAFNSKWFTRLDLHVSQDIPTGLGRSRLQLFADIENFTNLINHNWGQVREFAFPYNTAVTRVQCLTTAGNQTPTGTATPTGTVATSAAQTCAQYRYSPTGGAAAFNVSSDQIYVNQSLYSIRVGLRFTF